jgi:hypothetical protein
MKTKPRTLKTIPSFEDLVRGKETINVASYDVGRVAFAWSVEEWDVSFLREQREKFFSTKYKKDRKKGSKVYEEVKNAICLGGKRISLGLFDISSDEKKLDIETRNNLFRLLEENNEMWETVSLFDVEQQFCTSFGGRKKQGEDKKGEGTNMEAIKLSECLVSWHLIKSRGERCVFFVPTASKTAFLGAPKMPKKKDRKEWTVKEAISWAEQKGDEEEVELLSGKKNDDKADAKAQGKATVFKYVVTAE